MNAVKLHTILLLVCLLGLAGLASYILGQPKAEKQAFVLNERVFTHYKGTQLLEKKLAQLKLTHQRQLDSLQSVAFQPTARQQELIERFAQEQQALSEQYTADIWQQINQTAAEFGKEKGYGFIFGATGDGNLMYAKESENITDELIVYLNEKYDGNH